MHSLAPLMATIATVLQTHATDLGVRFASPAFSVRNQAEIQLVKLDRFALPTLAQLASASEDADVFARASDLGDRISIQRDRLRRSSPLLINQWRNSGKVSTLFADLELQTGYRFVVPLGNEVIRDRELSDLNVMHRRPFWEVLDSIADAAGLEVSVSQPITRRPNNPLERPSYYSYSSYPEYASLTAREVEVTPGGIPPLLLAPKVADKTARISRNHAVRVRASAMSDEARSGFDHNTLPIELTVTAEPRLAWVKTLSVHSIRATAGDGLKLSADLTPALMPYDDHGNRGDILVQRSNGNLYAVDRNDSVQRIWMTTDMCTSVIRLRCDYPMTKLREIHGIVRGIARTEPEAVVSTVLKTGHMTSENGQVSTHLKAVLSERDDEGNYPVEAVVTFPAYRVMPANGSDRDIRMAEYAARAGRPVRRDSRGWYSSEGTMIEGMVALTAKGSVCTLTTSTSMQSAFSLKNNEVFIHRTFRFLVKPEGATKEPPSQILFLASVERTVEAPFALHDLPVLAGTGSRD